MWPVIPDFERNLMMTLIAQLEITMDEADLIESSIRTQIDRLSRVELNDTPVDALEKHEKIFELLSLLTKMQQHRSTFRFDPGGKRRL